jgi:hypothetical protein
VFVEYAQAEPGDILMKITAWNRGPTAPLHLIPQLVLRNTWSWEPGCDQAASCAPPATARSPSNRRNLGMSRLYFDGAPSCCSPKTKRMPRGCGTFGGEAGYFKDAFPRAHRRRFGAA